MNEAMNQVARNLVPARNRVENAVRALGRPCPARFRKAVKSLADERGSTLIELAFTVPLLFLIFLGVFSFGITIFNQLTLTQAVGSGAQYLQIIRTSTTDPCADTFTAIKNAAPTLKSSNISLTLTMNGNPSVSGTSCSSDKSELVQGGPVTVQATYPCVLQTYGGFTNCTLSATVTEYEY